MAHSKQKPPQPRTLEPTLAALKNALSEWDKIPNKAETPDDELMKKTKKLIRELSKKIDELDL